MMTEKIEPGSRTEMTETGRKTGMTETTGGLR